MHISLTPSAIPAQPKATAVQQNSATQEKKEGTAQPEKNPTAKTVTLNTIELQQVRELKARDREVRVHEQAHLSAAGKYANGGASFTFQRGPNGTLYATGGEVSIDTSPVPNEPQATLEKANAIQRAAHAPTQPSAQDRAVAAKASQMATEARTELLSESTENLKESSGNASISAYEKIAGLNEENEDTPTKTLVGTA